MRKENIFEVLKNYGFSQVNTNLEQTKISPWSPLSTFEYVYSDSSGKEIYIIEEQKESMFSKDTISALEDRVKAFIYSRANNDGVRYNINLILLCPIDKKSSDYKEIVNLERNKYTCRKLFLDSKCRNFDDEVIILPFIPISGFLNYDVSELTNLSDDIKRITYNNEIILNELLTSVPDLKKIENELLKLEKGSGENDE